MRRLMRAFVALGGRCSRCGTIGGARLATHRTQLHGSEAWIDSNELTIPLAHCRLGTGQHKC